jgi:hypothetical protein
LRPTSPIPQYLVALPRLSREICTSFPIPQPCGIRQPKDSYHLVSVEWKAAVPHRCAAALEGASRSLAHSGEHRLVGSALGMTA